MSSTTDDGGHPYDELSKPDTNSETHIEWNDVSEGERWTADFYPLNKRDWYQKMDQYNSGLKNGERTNDPYCTVEANRHLIETFVSTLELTVTEERRAHAVYQSIDLGDMGVNKIFVAFALCCYLIEQDERDKRRAEPQAKNRDSMIVEYQSNLGIRQSQLMSLYGQMRDLCDGIL